MLKIFLKGLTFRFSEVKKNFFEVTENFFTFFKSFFSFLYSFFLLVTIFLWYPPLRLVIKILEPREKKRRKKAIRDTMGKMFPDKKEKK